MICVANRHRRAPSSTAFRHQGTTSLPEVQHSESQQRPESCE
jgi:hypothetical protein